MMLPQQLESALLTDENGEEAGQLVADWIDKVLGLAGGWCMWCVIVCGVGLLWHSQLDPLCCCRAQQPRPQPAPTLGPLTPHSPQHCTTIGGTGHGGRLPAAALCAAWPDGPRRRPAGG